MEQGEKEKADNKKAIANANSYAQQRQAIGENVAVYQMQPLELKEDLTAFHSSPENIEGFDPSFRGTGEGTAVWGAGAYFLLDKNFNIIK